MQNNVLSVIIAVLELVQLGVAQTWAIPLKSRAVGDLSSRYRVPRASRRDSTSELNIPLTDYFNRTDCQWYSTISIGTPPQDFVVLWDTGSAVMIIPENNCTTCGSHKLFNPATSGTFDPSPGAQFDFPLYTGLDSMPLNPPQTISGRFVQDTVAIGNFISTNQSWFLADSYPPSMDISPIDGIMGMSLRNTSSYGDTFFWRLYETGQLESPVYSFYLPAGEIYGAEVLLGGIDYTKFVGELEYAEVNVALTLSPDEEGFTYSQVALYAGEKLVKNSSTGANFAPGATYVDTGTAFIATPDYESARDIYADISPKIVQIDPAGAWGAPCEELDAVAVDITITVGPGVGPDAQKTNLTMPKQYFNLGEYPGQPGTCQAPFVNSVEPSYLPTGEGAWLIGSPLIKAYYTVWDGDNFRIGWGQLKA